MLLELLADLVGRDAAIAHQVRLAIDALHDLADVLAVDVRNVAGLETAAALDQRHDGVLRRDRLAVVDVLGLAADERLVRLDRLAGAAHRAVIRLGIEAHRLADAHGEEPGALVGDAERPMQLMRADALLAGGHQVEAQHPLRQRDLAALHDAADRHRERLLAVVAVDQAFAVRLAGEARDVRRAAVRADRAIRPAKAFEMGAGRILVVENRVREIDGHDTFPVLLRGMYDSVRLMSSI